MDIMHKLFQMPNGVTSEQSSSEHLLTGLVESSFWYACRILLSKSKMYFGNNVRSSNTACIASKYNPHLITVQ